MSQVDFTPQWYRNELHSAQNRRRRRAFVGALFLLMVSWFVINEGRISSAQAMLRDTEANSQQSQLLSARLQSIRNEKHKLQRELAHYGALQKQVPPSIVLAEISHRIPDEASLKNFRLAPASSDGASRRKRGPRSASVPAVRGSAPAHCRLKATLTAHATGSETMFRFVRNLEESALFAELEQGGISSSERGGVTVKQKTIGLYVLDAECIAP